MKLRRIEVDETVGMCMGMIRAFLRDDPAVCIINETFSRIRVVHNGKLFSIMYGTRSISDGITFVEQILEYCPDVLSRATIHKGMCLRPRPSGAVCCGVDSTWYCLEIED